MMKKMKIVLLFTLLFTFISCVNDIPQVFESEAASVPSADGKTYLNIDVDSISVARTIIPSTSDYSNSKLTNLTLKGKISGSSEDPVQLAHSDTYAKFSGNIPIAAGTWDLTLTAELDGSAFSSTPTTKVIEAGKINYLSFTLMTSEEYGGLKITVNFTGEATKVVPILQNQNKVNISDSDEPVIDSFSMNGDTKTFIYQRSITETNERLAGGTYYINFKFYNEDVPLNTYRSYVRIANGITTTATISLDLDETYTIEYGYYESTGGQFSEDELTSLGFQIAGGVVLPEFYSRRSETYTLPDVELTGYTFDGWELEGESITQITKGTTGDLDLHALFTAESGAITVTRTNPDATLTPTSGTLIFEVTGLSNPEEPWYEVNVDIKYYDAGDDYWYSYDADEGHNWSSDWVNSIYKLYLYSFSPDDQYKVVFYDADNNPLCSEYEFEFTVAELPVQTINIGSLDADGLTSAVQTAVGIFGSGKVKLAFTGTNSTDGVNLYSIVAGALASYQAAELDFSECSGTVVSEVPNDAFWNKFSGNATIALSDSTTKIGSRAFAQNSTITVSNLTNVTEIGEKAFYDNDTYSGIGDISLNSVTSIGNAAFGKCVIGTLYLGTNTSIEINSNAFYDADSSWNQNSTKIEELNIGNFEGDVKTPFNKCYRLSKFVVSDTNTVYYTDATGSKLYLKADDAEYMSTKN